MTSETKLPKAELWVATGLRGLETHQPNHVVGVSRDEVNEEVKSAHGPGWAVWMTEPYYTAEQMKAYARAAVEQASELHYDSTMESSAESYFRELKAPPEQAKPEGWVLVPREPTSHMIEESTGGWKFRTADCETLADERDLLRRQWASMLAAAPTHQENTP